MLTIAKLIDFEIRHHKEKPVCDLCFKLDNGEVIRCTLWSNSIEQNLHHPYQGLVGEKLVVDIKPDIYNSKLTYQLNTYREPVTFEQYCESMKKSSFKKAAA